LRILQAHTTLERATAAPGTVVRIEEGGALVAAADVLVAVQTVAVDGRSVAAGTAFSHGMMLQPGP
jgi:methionyl-tRNA formyltransferase